MKNFTVSEYVSTLLSEGYVQGYSLVSGRIVQSLDVAWHSSKAFIAQSTKSLHGSSKIFFELAYFPMDITHAALFSQSKVREDGPSDDYPGSVAVLEGVIGPNEVTVQTLQYCFDFDMNPPELSRGIVSKYMGARFRLLEYLFDEIPTRQVSFVQVLGQSKGSLNDLERVIAQKRKKGVSWFLEEDTAFLQD